MRLRQGPFVVDSGLAKQSVGRQGRTGARVALTVEVGNAVHSKHTPSIQGVSRVMTQEEDDERLSDDGIDETVDVDVDGKERNRRPLPKRKTTKTVFSEESGDDRQDAEGEDEVEVVEKADEAETDEQELGTLFFISIHLPSLTPG